MSESQDHSHDAGNPDRKVEPAPPTDQPQGDTESRLEHEGGEKHLTADEVERERDRNQ